MGYAFISYSTKNQAEAAAMRDLLNRNGVKTWMAPGDIPLGKKYAQVILQARKDESAEWKTIWKMLKAPDDKDLAVMLQNVSGSVKGSYSCYRLTVYATTGSDILQLSELDLIPAGNP